MPRTKPKRQESEYRSALGNMRVLAQENEYLYKVELWLLNGKKNRNGWIYKNLRDHIKQFVDTPILVAYINKGNKIGDGHNFTMKRGRDGKEYASFTDETAERIVGWFSDSDNIRIENKDGTEWIVATGRLWSWYAAELTEMLTRRGNEGMDVSIETLIEEMHLEDDAEVFTKYTVLGTTILGIGVTPAVAGAKIRALSMKEEMEKLKLRVASYQEKISDTTRRSGNRMNKAIANSLQARFEGYRVIAASDDGLNVCLLSEGGVPCTYSFCSKDETTIATERIKPVMANTIFPFENEEISVDAMDLLCTVNALKSASDAELEKTKIALQETQKNLESAKNRETAWHVNAAKETIKSTFNAFNEDQPEGEKIDVALCNELVKRAEDGEYNECLNKNGEWAGCEVAKSDMLAKCAEAVREINRSRVNAAKEAAEKAKNIFVWDRQKNNSGNQSGGIEGMIERSNNKNV